MKLGENLKNILNETPLTLVDVGALDGIKAPWSDIESKHLRTIAFEPQEDTGAAKADNFGVGLVALYDRQGSATMYLTKEPDASSLLEPNQTILNRYGIAKNYEVISTETVSVDTLDNQTDKQGLNFIDFIKLDTQGSELQILNESKQTLMRSVLGVEVEVNFIERYKGQHSFREVDQFLNEHGFEIFDLQRRFCKRKTGAAYGSLKGQLTHGTSLYLRTIDSAKAILQKNSDVQNRAAHTIHFILITLLYGYHDYAKEILEAMKADIPEACIPELTTLINKQVFSLPSFRGKYRLNAFIMALANITSPNSPTGRTGDQHLGNL